MGESVEVHPEVFGLNARLLELEETLEGLRKEIASLHPLPVQWRSVNCGRGCAACPHGPYPYLRVKKDGKWRWKYLGKGWQPPEGFVRAGEFRALLARYHALLKEREALLKAVRRRG